jgi:hypothetical protein
MADSTTKRKRTTPQPGTVVTAVPERTRKGFWAREFDWFKENPSTDNNPVIKKYDDVSQSTASSLRRDYGLDAVSRNTTEDGRCTLYVEWRPERANAIKAETAERGAKRKAARAKTTAAKSTK